MPTERFDLFATNGTIELCDAGSLQWSLQHFNATMALDLALLNVCYA